MDDRFKITRSRPEDGLQPEDSAFRTGLRIAQKSTEVTSDTMIFVSSAPTTLIKTVTSISMASPLENVVLEAKISLEEYENVKPTRWLC